MKEMRIEIIRSRRRWRTVSARMVNGVLELRVPAVLSRAKVNYFIGHFQKKLRRKRKIKTDKFLAERAKYLYGKFVGKKIGRFTICWSKRQQKIFGICNHQGRVIRISSRLKDVPSWVLNYVILHELCHLSHPNHGKKFWEVVRKYSKTERARGFLEGMNFGKKVN